MHVEWNLLHYSSVDQADLYQANVKSFGVTFDPQVQHDIGCKASNHCHAFMAAAMTEYAHAKMLIASKAMAMTAIDILHHPELMQETRSYFKNRTLVHVNEDLDTTIF